MAERMTQSWTTVPHFYLVREVNAERLVSWRAELLKRQPEKSRSPTSWCGSRPPRWCSTHGSPRHGETAASNREPASTSASRWRSRPGWSCPSSTTPTGSRSANSHRRQELAARAQAGRLRLEDLQGGNFTISNLGMYGVDAFNAIVNPPQAAILAVGRIADRVVAVNGQPAVRPTMILSLSCDHRAVDGARGAAFLDTLAGLIEEPLAILR